MKGQRIDDHQPADLLRDARRDHQSGQPAHRMADDRGRRPALIGDAIVDIIGHFAHHRVEHRPLRVDPAASPKPRIWTRCSRCVPFSRSAVVSQTARGLDRPGISTTSGPSPSTNMVMRLPSTSPIGQGSAASARPRDQADRKQKGRGNRSLSFHGVQSFRKICSIGSPNRSAMRKARGSEGSYLPVSIALTDWRDTSNRSARSPWLQSRSARRTFRRFSQTGSAVADRDLVHQRSHREPEAPDREHIEIAVPAVRW